MQRAGLNFGNRNGKPSLFPQGAHRWGGFSSHWYFPNLFPIPSKPLERKYAFYFTKLEGWLFRVAWSWKRNKWSGNLIKPDPSGRITFWAASVALDLEENSVVEKTMMESSTSPLVPRCEPHIFLPCCELCGCAHPCRKGTSSESLERLNQTCPIWPRELLVTLACWYSPEPRWPLQVT